MAENEVLYRQVNETVVAMGRGRSDRFAIACECGDAGCDERVTVTREAYEQTRSEPTHFMVKPGHELLEVETVVERYPGWLVVQKIGVGAVIAEKSDPRH
jgi:hypothetical protein